MMSGFDRWKAHELELTTQGLAGGLSSTINDFGHNRLVSADSTPGNTKYFNAWMGRAKQGADEGYTSPVFRGKDMEAAWRINTGKNALNESMEGWDSYINQTADAGGWFAARRKQVWNALKGGEVNGTRSFGAGNKFLAAAGGMGAMLAPGIAAISALSDAREGYRQGGFTGALTGMVGGYVKGAILGKTIGFALRNPILGLAGAAGLSAAAYGSYKVFDAANQGNSYLRAKRVQRTMGSSWARGPSPAMTGSTAMTMRQRSLMAMENSKFNTMKTLGSESYMINAPRSRYANSTSIGNHTPMLSY